MFCDWHINEANLQIVEVKIVIISKLAKCDFHRLCNSNFLLQLVVIVVLIHRCSQLRDVIVRCRHVSSSFFESCVTFSSTSHFFIIIFVTHRCTLSCIIFIICLRRSSSSRVVIALCRASMNTVVVVCCRYQVTK